MQVDSLVQLAESGNTTSVEQGWLSAVEKSDVTSEAIIEMAPVLGALARREKTAEAESLAWAAIETIADRDSKIEALAVAKAFLLSLNRSEELRAQVVTLYADVYADRPGIEALMEASGIAGGRPPRRAMRTLDVCLKIEPGCYATARHEDSVTRVEAIDTTTWEITIDAPRGTQTVGAMEFADGYAPCDADDFRALLHYDLDGLRTMMVQDPAAVITNILKAHAERLTADDLKLVLVPRAITADNWSKWWTKARAAVKQSPCVRIEGRSPYILMYDPNANDDGQEFETSFKRLATPAEQLSALTDYVRDCKARKQPPNDKVLGRLREMVAKRAARLESSGDPAALAERLVEWQIGLATGDADADGAAVALLSRGLDSVVAIRSCESAGLWRCAIECLPKAVPEGWKEVVVAAFPFAPAPACEKLAELISDLPERSDGIVDSILADSVSCFEALCWLWDKGLSAERWQSATPLTVLTRLLRMLSEVKQDDSVTPEVRRRIYALSRSSLSARKYERFKNCLSEIESGMAAALRTSIGRLDNLGRNVREDLLNRIRDQFPDLYVKAEIPPWEMEDVIFGTEAGMTRWEEAISELVNVKMKENAKAIGEAAEKGDLSENSEYKFALEERDLLRARLAHMQSQFVLARVIQPDQVTIDNVAVGSRVTFKHRETGTELVMTFLGPFEADSEKRIYNYKAPLAQEIMGMRIGEDVEITIAEPQGVYEITALAAWE